MVSRFSWYSLLFLFGILVRNDGVPVSQPNQYLYVAIRNIVMRGEKEICRAVSSMKARLIAKALNYFSQRNEGRYDRLSKFGRSD